MSEQLDPRSTDLKAWMLLHRTRDLAFNCEDRVFSKYGLTAEQYTTLAAIECFDDPVRPTDIGGWVGHRVNTVSMMVDRMVKAGLIKRMRDLPDRREVRVTISKKGEEAFAPATPAAWDLVQDVMSPLSDEEKRTLIRLLEKVRDKAVEHLSPEGEIRESKSYETADLSRLMERLGQYVPKSTRKTPRQSAAKRKK